MRRSDTSQLEETRLCEYVCMYESADCPALAKFCRHSAGKAMHAKAVAPPALTVPPEIQPSPTSTVRAGLDEPDHEHGQEEYTDLEARRLKHNARVRFNRTIKRHLHEC